VQQPLLHVLVHSDGRTQHTGADVGDVRQFQQPLDGPVFAIRAVQDRKHDVDIADGSSRVLGIDQFPRRGSRQEYDLAACAVERRQRRLCQLPEGPLTQEVPVPSAIDADQADTIPVRVDSVDDAARRAQ
jgi:hypothetical protein